MTTTPRRSDPAEAGSPPDAAAPFQRRGEPEELTAPCEPRSGRGADGAEGDGSSPTPAPASDPRGVGRSEGRGIGEAGGAPGEVGGPPSVPTHCFGVPPSGPRPQAPDSQRGPASRPADGSAGQPADKPTTERQLDQAIAESFPASDPTSTQREAPGAGDAPPDLSHRLPPERKPGG